ncbi:MAG TPA: amino acid adenylation domain-containing protein, partial [Thermoanaerobaculia bacterium]|nr:amino acid adenylation domain-containing protein [Thermoanaerobaculia bacterium]
MLLHETFETQARRTPDRVAVLAGPAHLTYAELDRRADQLAGSLRRLGVGPEVRVGLCLARDLPLVTAILAVLKAGGVYVPLDPTYPTPRLALLLEDSGATVLLTQESLLPVLPAHAARVVQLDANRPWSDAATPPEDAAEGRSALPRNLAYLIYTSGSTGRPKSVAIAHESAVALVRWALSVFAAEELAGVLFSTSVCFDLSIFELFTPLAVGGSLVVAGNALDLPALPAAQAVTLVNTVPSAMAELVRRNGVPTSVQTVNLAGEALPGALAEAIYGTTAVDRVWNLYGPSESTTYSTFALVERGALGEPSIGRPIDGTRAYLLDEQGEPAGAGEAGEIVLGGAGLARGYLDRPDLTAERFTPDPLAVAPGERVYRTGDLGRPLPDGSLHFVGRVDQQVKVRGFRIELGEVEAALARHPALEEVAVAARAHSAAVAGDRRLVAYVVAASPPPTARQLRDFLLQSLPASMVPSVFVRLPALPRRPNGKLDRQLLPEPGAFRDDLAAAFSPPEGPIEERLAGLWAEVLGGERIGRDDDFFALGGHSLLATRLLSRVRDTLGADLPFGALFAAPTVADLAGRVEAALATAPSPLPPLLPPAPHPTRVPLAPGLFGMWFDARREPDLPLYNIAQAVILRGPLDPVALATALAALVCRHDALRTRFLEIDGQPVQEALPPSPPALPVLDLGSLPAADRIREAARLGRHEVRWRFDPASGKLLRAVLVRLAAAEHLLLRTVHHLVFDGLSEEIFWRELSVFYSAAIDAVDTAPPPDLPLGFADYAWWQHRWLGETLAGQVSWWRERLSDLAPLALPTDRPRPALESRRGGELRSLLPAPLVGDVRDVARRQGATPFMALLAAFSALLHRYSGQEDFAVGAPVAGRGPSALEGLIGCFVNLLPLRAGFAGRPTGGRLLTQTRETALAAFAQQDVPYARLVGELAGERDPNRAALVQVAFQLVGEVHPAPRLPGVIAVSAGLHNGTAKFDLDLELEERGEEIGVRCEYRLDLFDPPTVVRLLDHFARLTAALVASLGQPVIDLPLLSAAEAHQTLAEWNDTAVGRQDGAPEGPWVHEIFAEQAGWRPEALAVTAGGQVLSYGELDRRARRLAGALRGLGVGPEVRVGIGIERSPELVIAVLAVLQAGGAFVALDPTLPEERLGFQLEDSGAPVLLTRRGPLADRAAGLGIRCLFPHEPSVGASLGTLTTLQPDNLAYVIYTSGSTGRPKGVELCHGALANLIAWHRSTFAVTQNDRATLLAGVGFDAAVWETWPYLASGASLHVLPEAIRTAPEELRDWLITQGITVTWLPVPLAEAVLDLPWAPDGASRPALRCLLTGSDRLHRYPPTALPFPLLNTYGPTEGTVISTCGIVPAADSRSQERGAPGIGRPLDNVRVHVVDPLGGDLRPVPCGVPGELLIGGAGLARGYLCRPDLTAERFLPDPFAAPPLPPGERLYRTGDLVRWLPDGEIDFLGRIDHQVKIRGYRIELGEIESVLARHPAVREAVVLAPDGGIGGLVAFFTACENGAPPEAVELRDLLFRQLPEYMIPARFVPLAVLPLNASGKVDRQALTLLARQLGPVVGDAGDHEKAPRTPVEELLANLWEGILERSPIRTGDNFFDLGGHSLLVTRLLARIREVLGMSLPVQAVFEHPTLGALARAVETARPEAAETALPPLVPVVREGRLPLSFAQQRLWFLDRLAPGGATYNVPVAYALRGPLAPVALAASLTEVVRRHEALRTRFVEVDGAPWQEIEAPQPVPLALVDLGRLSSWRERQDAEVARLGREDIGRPFDLTRGPLLRARLVRLSAAEHALQLSVHHIAFDGWSAGLLRGELSALYAAHAAHAAGVERRLSPLPELPVQYADFAVWQRAWPPEVLAGQLAYWRRQLAGAPTALELPTDRPRPAVQSFRGAVRERCLPDELAALLRQAARREGVTLHMLLLAGFAALLSRYTEQEDLLIGTPVANRTRPEVFGLIGFFVNTLVLRARLSDAPDFRRLLVATRDSTLSAFAHQDLPFEALVEELKPERDLGRNPLIQVLLVLQSAGRAAEAWELRDGLRFTPLRPAESRTAKFDLSLAVEEQGETLALELEVAADLFTTSTAARLLGHYAALLAGAARNPDSPVARLPLLGKEERQQLAAEWNDTASAFPRRSLHRLFEAQAAARPEAVAVVWENGELTYGELDRRAGRIARALRRLGVGPEARVGLCFERSAEWVTAMLGILKAGGVYLPLDPTYPRERLDLLLQDAAPAVLVGIRPLLEKLPGTVPRLALEALETIPEVSGPEVEPEGLAYVLYTSGSTGMPKGVEICHQAVVRLVRKTGYAAFGPGEVFLQLAPLSFDAATLEIWGPLLNGGRLALFPPRPFSLAELEAAVARYGVTTLWLTAGLFHLAVDEGLAGFAGLRQLLAGGDVLSRGHVERALAQLPGVELINGYGPTENTTFSATHRLRRSLGEGSVPIGRPIANSRAYVLDRELELVPVGVVGELYVGGAGLARGYLQRPERTAERFIPAPFGGVGGGRLYRTGDRARWRVEGVLEFLGRRDFQVKIRGFRVELGEVESALLRHPGIREAVVTAGAESLVAYYVPAGDEVDVAELRTFLGQRLPEPLVPSAFVALAALPLSSNGKVDRRALPAPEEVPTAGGGAAVAPRTPVEAALAAIWEEVLGLDRIGVHDNFFHLGGHSLLALRVLSRLRATLGVTLPLQTLFASPTIAELAAAVAAGSTESLGSE